MLRLIRLVLAIVGIVVVASLAVANRGLVEVSFWPLPFTYTVPLFIVALACLALGALVMAIAAWFGGLSSSFRAARERRRVAEFEERERLRHEAAEQAELDRLRQRRQQLALANAGGTSQAVTVSGTP